MEGCIFENISPAAPARLSHTVLSTKLGEVRDHMPLPSHHPIPSSLVLPGAFFSISIHLSIHLSIYLSQFSTIYMPISSSPALPYLVTILKGTLLAHYIPYLPLKYMIKMHTDLAKKTILRKSLLGKRPLNICGTTTGRSRATGLLQNLKSSL